MLTLFGASRTRAHRCLWMLEELELPYTHVPMSAQEAGGHKDKNPNGKVPFLDDGGVTIFESMAINCYLVGTYDKGKLLPEGPEAYAKFMQWSFWAATEIEGPLVGILIERLFKAEPDEQHIENLTASLVRPFRVLEEHLKGRTWQTDDAFRAADLNVSSILALARRLEMDLSPYPAISAWLDRCLARPAWQKVQTLP